MAHERLHATEHADGGVDSLSATYVAQARMWINVKDYGALGDGVTDDTAAIVAAMVAAQGTVGQGGKVVFFPKGTYLTTGLSLNGRNCVFWGEGPGTIIKAKAGQAGYVIDLTGYAYTTDSMAFHEFRDFWVQGDGTAGAAKGGIRVEGAGLSFRNIGVKSTGGPCFRLDGVQLSAFENIICGRPVSADVNSVPYIWIRGATIGNQFFGIGLRSETATADGPAGLLIEDDGTYSPSDNVFVGCWAEFCHPPANGSVVVCKGNNNAFTDFTTFDVVTIGNSVSLTSVFRLSVSAATNFGGNTIRGKIPGGSAAADTHLRYGVIVEQSRNRIEGTRGFGGLSVLLSAGVEYTFVFLGGQESGDTNSLTAVTDSSGNSLNSVVNSFYAGLILSSLYLKGGLRFGTPASDGSSDGPLMQQTGTTGLLARLNSLTVQDLGVSVTMFQLASSFAPTLRIQGVGDEQIARFTSADAARVLALLDNGSIEGQEVAAPGAPAANKGRLFFQDNGAGKTQLAVRFNTGAVQVIATEP